MSGTKALDIPAATWLAQCRGAGADARDWMWMHLQNVTRTSSNALPVYTVKTAQFLQLSCSSS